MKPSFSFALKNWKRIGCLTGIVFLLLVPGGFWIAGSLLYAPYRKVVGQLPPDLQGRSLTFDSQSGARLQGWFLPGKPKRGAVLLLHGVHATRLAVLNRARFLKQAGYAVLLFDFQAHGESSGDQITFGWRESQDAQTALTLLRKLAPGEKAGVIGVSMGGAAALLASPRLEVEAIVLEMVYPDIETAVSNRLTMRLGSWAAILTPGLTLQLKPRLGIAPESLCPLRKLHDVTVPKLILAGTNDAHTTIAESRHMFQTAAEPKQYWEVTGAAHVDLYNFAPAQYETRVGTFLAQNLRS
ncbi:MAG: lysophospholipase [Blastocatellia bacterium]|nr:lysophospholipase [Blastocatellia bacterium]